MNMRWRLNPCREHRENVSLLASGALRETKDSPLRDHLARCPQCRQYYEEIASLSADFQLWASTETPIEADPAFRARWMRSVQSADRPARRGERPREQQQVQSANIQTRTSLAALISRWSESFWPSPLAWAALAAVWVCLLSLQWAAAPRRAGDQELARSPSSRRQVTFAQRQRELSSLLESSVQTPAPKAADSPPRPHSQRGVDSVTT